MAAIDTPTDVLLDPRYQRKRLLGRGGFASVYLAQDRKLNRLVAVKVLDRGLINNREAAERFQREAHVVASLRHNHIVEIHDYAEFHGTPYIVMEYVPGGTLHDRLQQGPLSLRRTNKYLHQIADALHDAHRQNLVHRDVKPSNLLLSEDSERVYLADFGIVRVVSGITAGLTAAIGTVSYMAPEQFAGRVKPATDIYALACTTFELVTSTPPYQGTTAEIIHGHCHAPIPQLAERSATPLPSALQQVFERALAKQPDDRYPTATAFADAFEHACGKALHEVSPPDTKGKGKNTGGDSELPWGIIIGAIAIAIAFFAYMDSLKQGELPPHTPTARPALTVAAPTIAPPLNVPTLSAAAAALALRPQNPALVLKPPTGEVLYASNKEGPWALYILRADGTGERRLTELNADSFGGAWSPDGRRIAFVSTRDGNREIYVMNADATAPKRMTNQPGPDNAPTWAPDGTSIVYTSDQGKGQELRWLTLDGKQNVELVKAPAGSPTWGRTGEIVFTRPRSGSGPEALYATTLNEEGFRLLAGTDTARVDTPAFSPDGQQLVFTSGEGAANRQLILANADGSNRRALTALGADTSSPTWSPDGMWIVFASTIDGTQQLYAIRSDGTGLRALTSGAGKKWYASWRP